MIKYLQNCFWLLIPILIWNLLFFDQLPRGYNDPTIWDDIPWLLDYLEKALRVIVFGLPLFMKFSLKAKTDRLGFGLYILGVLVYFLSWILVMVWPESAWSTSMVGFSAPAFTPLFWLLGIGVISQGQYGRWSLFSVGFILFSCAFVAAHTFHALLAFQKL